MHTLSDSLSLFDFSIHFTFLLVIIFSFQHFPLLFTFPEVKKTTAMRTAAEESVPQDYTFSSTHVGDVVWAVVLHRLASNMCQCDVGCALLIFNLSVICFRVVSEARD